MPRKKLKGFHKTRHFRKRQDERKVSDQAVKKALEKGEVKSGEHGDQVVHGELKLTVNLEDQILITVHPGDPLKMKNRVLTKDEATRIQEDLKQKEVLPEEDFLSVMRRSGVKKTTNED